MSGSKKTKNTHKRRSAPAAKKKSVKTSLKSAETMAQAAAILEAENSTWNLAALKWAKRQGCTAFRGPRVYLAEFKEWWETHGKEYQAGGLKMEDVLDRELKQDKLDRLRREDEIEAKKWLPTDKVVLAMKAIGQKLRGSLQVKFEIEQPLKAVGRDVITITELNKSYVDELCQQFHNGIKEFFPAEPEALTPEYEI